MLRKKMSSFSRSRDWRHAHNYVAKRYMADDVGREVYFEDVRLQMDAKLWGEEFNRHNPPKKVHILWFLLHYISVLSPVILNFYLIYLFIGKCTLQLPPRLLMRTSLTPEV